MKKFLIILVASVLVQGCKKDEISKNITTINLQSVPTWATIDFKTNYTIQVPPEFKGPGMIGFEGNTFSKYSADSMVIMQYGYCNGLYCKDFGNILQIPASKSLKVIDNSGKVIIFNKVEIFSTNSETLGVLYYSGDSISIGRLYRKDNAWFKQALQITFHQSEQATVEKIIGSIKKI